MASSPLVSSEESVWAALSAEGVTVHPQAALRDFTTFRLGGPCPCLLHCRTAEQLVHVVSRLAAMARAYELIGGGSNLLVSDAGLDVWVVRYETDTPVWQREGETLEVSGATRLDDLARVCAEQGLAGLGFAAGIPGTVGGAIAGNAGAFGEQVGDVLVSVRLLDRRGRVRDVPPEDLDFGYRRSRLQRTPDIVVAARFRLRAEAPVPLLAQREERLALRRAKHPDWRTTPTAGSFFRNVEPTSAAGRRQAAGWFLEQAGGLTMAVGGARPFARHANILIQAAPCRAQDVLDLARRMAAAVQAKFGLVLVREVRLLGPFAGEGD